MRENGTFPSRKRGNYKGYTVLELVVVIGIMLVLLVIGVSKYRDWQRRHFCYDYAYKFAEDYGLCRFYAVSSNGCEMDVQSDGWQVVAGGKVVKKESLPNMVRIVSGTGTISIRSNGLSDSGTVEFECYSYNPEVIYKENGSVKVK